MTPSPRPIAHTLSVEDVRVGLKSLSRLSSGDLKVRRQTKFKLPRDCRSRSNSPGTKSAKRSLAASMKRSHYFQEMETIQWKNLGVTNDAWDRSNPTNNIGGGVCFATPTNASEDSSSHTSLSLLSPHVLQLLAREDFSLPVSGHKRSARSQTHRSNSPRSKPSCLKTSPKKARNSSTVNQAESLSQVLSEIHLKMQS